MLPPALAEPVICQGLNDIIKTCISAQEPEPAPNSQALLPRLVLASHLVHWCCSVNDSKYGLQAGVFTHDLDKAWHAFEKLDVGGVVVGHVPSIRVDAQVGLTPCPSTCQGLLCIASACTFRNAQKASLPLPSALPCISVTRDASSICQQGW